MKGEKVLVRNKRKVKYLFLYLPGHPSCCRYDILLFTLLIDILGLIVN